MDGITTPSQKMKVPLIEFSDKIFPLYLSHPSTSREYVREWELGFEERNPSIALLNPFYDIEGEGREDIRARDEGKGFEKSPGYDWRLVRRDLIAMTISRGEIAIVDKNGERSWGTPMEAVYSTMLRHNPRILVCTNGDHDHPWFREHFHAIYTDFDSMENEIGMFIEKARNDQGF